VADNISGIYPGNMAYSTGYNVPDFLPAASRDLLYYRYSYDFPWSNSNKEEGKINQDEG
jgi:hypothetical protein